jgi:GDP-L-fucose synthase
MDIDSNITIFGGSGLLGSAIYRVLMDNGYSNVSIPSHQEVDLLNHSEVSEYLENCKPDNIFMAAGLVGGIQRNRSRPADFLFENTMMAMNLFNSTVSKSPDSRILYTGATCVYPRECPQPIGEESFLSGDLEETSLGYAVAKIAGVVGCQKYNEQYGLDTIPVMPAPLYGIGDNYNLQEGHFTAGAIKRFLEAKKIGGDITLWGSGNPRRELLYSDDCADALINLMRSSSNELVNIGIGHDYSIRELANSISSEIEFRGDISWDSSKPDGTFQKLTSTSKLMKIYPEFNPRTFKEGLRSILQNDDEVERILAS